MLWLAIGLAHAQIYNPLAPRPTPPPPGPVYSLAAGVDIDQGNTDRIVLKGSAGAHWVRERVQVLLALKADTSWAQKETTSQSGFAHGRLTHLLRGPWNSVSFVQGTANPFKDLLSRSLVGTGVEWSVYPSDRLHVVLATTVMAEYQVFEPGVVDEDAGLHARSSSYVVGALQLDKRLMTGLSGFFQPRLDAPANQRATGAAFLAFDLSSGKSREESQGPLPKGRLKWSASLDYDSQPPPDVERLDLGIDLTLGVTWK